MKVQFSIAYLKWRLKPSSESEKKRFAELFFRLNNKSYDVYSKYLSEHESKEGRTYKRFNDALFIEDYFVDYDQFFFKHEQIYDLIQGFFKIAKLNELDDPYLHHLADEAFDYGLHKGPDLEGFIDHYEANKHKMAVQIPESDSAINIMTIHKSKGLEFPVVIIPSMDFSNEVKSSFLTEVNDHIVYKKLGKNELIRQLSYLHQRESEQVIGDNMNKCYVAMTRPRERLYIGNHFSKSSFGSMFHETLIKSEFSKSSEDALIVEIGQRDRTIKDQNNKNDIAYSPEKISDHLWFPSIALQDKEELLESDSLSKKKRFGDDFHLIISRVNEESDIDKITKQAIGSGEISNENEPKILQQLQDLFKDSEYQSLFSDSLNILNEQEFIINEDKSLRPDKIILKKDETIIIDYKTGLPKRRDHNQVLEYIEVLNTMNYPSIKGYLYYVANQSLVRCS